MMLKIDTNLRTTILILKVTGFYLKKSALPTLLFCGTYNEILKLTRSGSSCELTISAIRRTQAKTN